MDATIRVTRYMRQKRSVTLQATATIGREAVKAAVIVVVVVIIIIISFSSINYYYYY
jgi:preprotein translocase subunit SecE